jgi:HD superfamily phosphodiesterase
VQRIPQIEQYVREVMAQVVRPDLRLAHDFKHVDRVRTWAVSIAQHEGFADLDLVEAAALLHDIGLAFVEHRRDHPEVGATYAARCLAEHQLFTTAEIATIAEAIRTHSSLSGGGDLGAMLRDADMLDIFGAVGIMRAFTSKYALPEYDPLSIKGDTWGLKAGDFTQRFANSIGAGPFIVDQINFQLSCRDNFHTTAAQAAAQPLIAFMEAYLFQLEREIAANDWRLPPADSSARPAVPA